MAEENSYIFRGDDLGSFGNTFLTVSINEESIPEGESISKAAIKIGTLPAMIYQNPEFPIRINLNSLQTQHLQQQNSVFMAVWDSQGRKQTCRGTLSFVAKNQIV